jgi:hypothetical protein
MTDKIYEGGCLCGAIRYRADGDPYSVVHCHCSLCRRAAGAPMVTWASFNTNQVGITEGAPKRYQSSDIAWRSFCSDCGTQITFQFKDRPDSIDLTLASFDHPEEIQPLRHIFEGDRVAWLSIEDGLPRFAAGSPKPAADGV